ncbi:probable histidine kinase 6 isoform X2 [Phragmites australis]|uniref:probable histidine kinase 6 isoform X2 n=1 Tax=Phragmites australis TaxID=29695 RepID=UPI002D780E77|nr:probable histidine kinase 6 isoform X2 [Phragmites australis]
MGGKYYVARRKGWRGLAAAAWVVLAVACSAAMHWHLRQESMDRAEERLVSMCEERARMLQEQFGVTVNHVHALAILISTFHYEKLPSAIDQDTFAKYTGRTSFERPLLNGVAYAHRLIHHEREMFESQQGWIMNTMKREAAPRQDEYAPVIFSQDTVSYLARIDMMSGEEDRENILRARATGKAVLTNPFRLLGSNHLGVVLTFAVYRPDLPADASVDQRVEATIGYLGGAFDVETLVENLLSKLAGNQDIVVNVYDATNASEAMVLYGPPSLDNEVPLLHVSMLDFGDPFRRHEMRYRQKPPMPWSAITNPLGTFVIWMLLGYIICAAWSRYDKVSEDCRKMKELKTQAEAADVAKSQFLATVSHEIRTPMNGVLGMLDMLLGTELTLTQKDYAQTAQMCGCALITLINDVLDRAKIEAGKLELEAVPFDLRSLMDDVISLFSSKSREKCIELAVFVCDDVPKVVIGDPWRFRQILTNLVGNAVKFTEQGHVFVRVCLAENSNVELNHVLHGTMNGKDGKFESTANGAFNTLSGFEAADRRNSWQYFKLLLSDKESLLDELESEKSNQSESDRVTLVISIEDTGVGIPLHAQDRVFTPFMQADSSTSRNYGGTGIGLSISKCLAELMGGQISFTSRPFVGSTFTFSAVLKRSYKDTSGDSGRSLSEALPTAFKGMKAILIDGRPVRSAVTRYHLKRLGIIVQIVNNMSAGLKAFSGQNGATMSREKASMLFIESDIWRPKTDVQLLNCLRGLKNGQLSEVPKVVLLVTSEADKEKYGSTFDVVMCKPIRASTIASCIQQLLEVEVPERKENQNRPSFLHSLLVGKNILVVDDNKVNLRVAAAALRKYGAKVHCVENGKDAISLLQPPHCFDACFMDVQMPEMDGFEATRQIRQMEMKSNEERKNKLASCEGSTFVEWHLPVLAMTADVIQATYEECIKSGMNGYVSKPFDEEQLYQAVSRLVVGTTDSAV